MAGAGYNSFTAASVLTASQVNTFLMDQSVMVFASAAARNTALASPSQGMVSFLNNSGTTWIYYGLYNASTNRGGAKAAGWYPTGNTAVLFGAATRTTVSLTSYKIGASGFGLAKKVDNLGWHNPGSNPTRFTPNVEGLYEFSVAVQYASNVNGNIRRILALQNGSGTPIFSSTGDAPASTYGTSLNFGLYMNGTTDYMEFEIIQNSAANLVVDMSVLMKFVRPVSV
jgi:hypothetical protein